MDYIVGNTVGKLLANKTPKKASELRILDPACGSGSFLIGAYQYLLDWHLNYYLDDSPEKYAKGRNPPWSGTTAGWRLTTAERKRILTNNIYGVDIDSQAVEVTKLSLLLKVLEGETEASLSAQMKMLFERALPDLGGNIKCGNSLIGPDFYAGRQLSLLDEEEMYRINVFDWNSDTDGFGAIMKAGGFDAVIGNPPYIRIQALKEFAPVEVEFYKRGYSSASKGNYDIYVVFAEKGLTLLRPGGRLGYILPSKFFTTDYGRELRLLLTSALAVSGIVDFGHAQVFHNATTYTCLLFLTGSPSNSVTYTVSDPLALSGGSCVSRDIPVRELTSGSWTFAESGANSVIEKIHANSVELLSLPVKMSRGSSTRSGRSISCSRTAMAPFMPGTVSPWKSKAPSCANLCLPPISRATCSAHALRAALSFHTACPPTVTRSSVRRA